MAPLLWCGGLFAIGLWAGAASAGMGFLGLFTVLFAIKWWIER